MNPLAEVKLSLLDLVAVRQGGSVAEALQIATDAARHAEKLGFARIGAEPNGETVWRLDVGQYSDRELPMKIEVSTSAGSASAA